jgi:hypothetical protein
MDRIVIVTQNCALKVHHFYCTNTLSVKRLGTRNDKMETPLTLKKGLVVCWKAVSVIVER